MGRCGVRWALGESSRVSFPHQRLPQHCWEEGGGQGFRERGGAGRRLHDRALCVLLSVQPHP